MREVPRVLVTFVLPKLNLSDPEEGLSFALDPASGDLVCQLALTREHFAAFDYEHPCSIPMPREAALQLAHELLRAFSPQVADFLERALMAASLRVISSGAGGPEAA